MNMYCVPFLISCSWAIGICVASRAALLKGGAWSSFSPTSIETGMLMCARLALSKAKASAGAIANAARTRVKHALHLVHPKVGFGSQFAAAVTGSLVAVMLPLGVIGARTGQHQCG